MKSTYFSIFLITIILSSISLGLGARVGRKSVQDLTNHKRALSDCRAQSGATQSDMDAIKMKKIPTTKTGRCLVQCIFNSAKIMDDGRFNKNGMVIAFTPALKGDLTKLGKLKQLSEVCENEIGTGVLEDCEGPKKIVECVAKHGNAYGFSYSSQNI
ncbi:unnamed protein product [Phaedon cochleariae]|uniref:Uncharacterized protein n=1 Tax=Phaedon cochleariae TaxID=80249 RepID=A0A9P0GY50_PHACE|nr:unnamed protein product [Phaedon cochleariae]